MRDRKGGVDMEDVNKGFFAWSWKRPVAGPLCFCILGGVTGPGGSGVQAGDLNLWVGEE